MDPLRLLIARMAEDAEKVARETDEWWDPLDVAADLRQALAQTDNQK